MNFVAPVQFITPIYPMLRLQFDDGFATDYTLTLAELQSRELKATFATVPNWVGDVGRTTWAQVKEIQAAGHSTQCHTLNHVDLRFLTEQEIRDSFAGVDNAFIAEGLALPEHTTAPAGVINEADVPIVSEYRNTLVRNVLHPNRSQPISFRHTLDLMAMPYYEHRTNQGDIYNFNLADGRKHLQEVLTQLIRQRRWMTIILHEVIDGDTVPDGTVNKITLSSLRSVLDIIVNSGIPVVTVEELYARVAEYRGLLN